MKDLEKALNVRKVENGKCPAIAAIEKEEKVMAEREIEERGAGAGIWENLKIIPCSICVAPLLKVLN